MDTGKDVRVLGVVPTVHVATHYNNREEVGIIERENSPIIGLKRFNNWVKSAVISMGTKTMSRSIRVMDLGCGKGGDLKKWDKRGLSFMLMVDIASVSVEQARARFEESNFKWAAHFYSFDCFSVPIGDAVDAEILGKPFDCVSLQFCMHYGWDTEERARTMLDNISRYLRVGGVFVATIPDSETIYARLNAQPDPEALSFGNSKYRVTFNQRHPPNDLGFGHQYSFWLEDAVDDVPEYVIPWDKLVQ
ncbi:mRNA (guanine-N(7))-methyltransferase [Malassezia cuniculi]|uniref:mRNA cap guanine-N(7) methyltransferase n=1 Tax=Malassezia cuniculi TaxID=948313 RepID=A0AAF0EVB8_9BASI|nr:mRNA (guanine-N(7))-methyltransferase [Malassezia cuniculi]